MDFETIMRDLRPRLNNFTAAMGSNNTSAGARLPDGLEQLVPLLGTQLNPFLRTFMVANHAFGAYLGLDPAAVVTFLGLLWAASRLVRQTWQFAAMLVRQHLTASVQISSDDDIYEHIMKWLAAQPHVGRSRFLMAESAFPSAWEEDVGAVPEDDIPLRPLDGDGPEAYLNFSNQHSSTVSPEKNRPSPP